MRSIAFVTVLTLASPGAAQSGAVPPQQVGAARQACAGDLARHCAGIEPGGGRIAACLRRNAPSLSEGCRSALIAARAGRR